MKSINFGAYSLIINDGGKVSVQKDGAIVENATQGMNEIAHQIGFTLDPSWNTQQKGAKLFNELKAISADENIITTSNVTPLVKNSQSQPAETAISDKERVVKRLEDEISRLKTNEVAHLQKYNELAAELKQAREENEDCVERNGVLADMLEEAREKYNNLVEKYKGLAAELKQVREEKEALNKVANTIAEKGKELAAELEQALEERDNLIQKYNELVKEANRRITEAYDSNSSTSHDQNVRVRFIFKIKGLLGWQRVSRIVTMDVDEYKALLKSSDKSKRNYIINHAGRFDLGLVQTMNVEDINGVSIERDD